MSGVDAISQESGDVFNPATGEKIAVVPYGNSQDVDAAVSAAKKAFPAWRKTPPLTRARYLFRIKEAFEENFEEIAQTLTTEQGKVIDEARGEVRRMIENVEHATGVTTLMTGYTLEDICHRHRLLRPSSAHGSFWGDRSIQFPGHGCLVVPTLCYCCRQHLCGKTFRAGTHDPKQNHEDS